VGGYIGCEGEEETINEHMPIYRVLMDVIVDDCSKQLWSLSLSSSRSRSRCLDLGSGISGRQSCQDSQDCEDFEDDDDREAWRARSDCGGRASLSKHGMEEVSMEWRREYVVVVVVVYG
jgi:hypothetical protein